MNEEEIIEKDWNAIAKQGQKDYVTEKLYKMGALRTVNLADELKVNEAKEKLSKCYYDIIDFIGMWVDIPEENKKLIAIWIIGTYFHKSFSTYPYIFLNAMRGSGKTRLLSIISWLQAKGKGDVLNNPSDAVLFRTAQERGLIFDEFESEKSKEKQTMREYLNSCYKKGGMVYRMEKQKSIDGKEKQVAVGYNLFTPIAMANINGIEDVLEDRSITLILEKSSNPSMVKKIEDFDTNKEIQRIKRTLEQFSVELCHVELLQRCIEDWNDYVDRRYYTPLHTIHTQHNSSSNHTQIEEEELYLKIDETGIFGRNLELFFPLIITGKILNFSIFEEVLSLTKVLNKSKKENEFAESKDVSLIEFVSLADRYRFEMILVHQLLGEFKEFIGTHGEEEDRWITSNWIGLALKRLQLTSQKKRVAKGHMVLLNVDKAKEKLRMYKTTDDKKEEDSNANPL